MSTGTSFSDLRRQGLPPPRFRYQNDNIPLLTNKSSIMIIRFRGNNIRSTSKLVYEVCSFTSKFLSQTAISRISVSTRFYKIGPFTAFRFSSCPKLNACFLT